VELDDSTVREQTAAVVDAQPDTVVGRSLVAVLQAVQQRFGYLPRPAMQEVASRLQIPASRVYGVATFYNQFRFTPPGRHAVRVCMGTACAIKLGGVILDAWERRLEIEEGETTADREYSLERVACVGCCSLAPVVLVGDTVHGNMTPTKVDGLLLQHRLADEKEKKQQALQENQQKRQRQEHNGPKNPESSESPQAPESQQATARLEQPDQEPG
jgi:NADH-quinone oxidoreductase subunit E